MGDRTDRTARGSDGLHELAERRSLAYHRAVVEALRDRPQLAAEALARVVRWRAEGTLHPQYAAEWERLLRGDLDVLFAQLVDEGERGCALRQVTPFAGVIDPRRRWQLWRDVRCEWEESPR